MCLTIAASASFTTSWRSRTSYPSGTRPPIQMPLRLEAAILSRMSSPVTSFELREREQHVKGQASHGRRGIELLGHGDERDGAGIEDLDHLGEIRQRARQPVHLINDDGIDQPLVD